MVHGVVFAQEFNSLKLEKWKNPDKDNIIYPVDQIFSFKYTYIKNGVRYMVRQDAESSIKEHQIVDNWSLVREEDTQDSSVIKKIVYQVVKPKLFKRNNKGQTEVQVKYPNRFGTGITTTGLVENKDNIWFHPPRKFLFKILEINPFPYIKRPFTVGNQWTDSLSIGEYWSDGRWKKWKGRITNKYSYNIKEKTSLTIDSKKIDCYVINAIAKSELGETKLISYFNEQYGFVKLIYTNIDKSTLILELEKLPLR